MVKGMTRPRALTIAVAALVSLGVLSPAAPAQAAAPDVPDAERVHMGAHYSRTNEIVDGYHQIVDVQTFTNGGYLETQFAPPKGTKVDVTLTSCGRVVRRGSFIDDGIKGGAPFIMVLSPDGSREDASEPNLVNRLVGPAIEVNATITYPGYAPYESVADIIDVARDAKRPTCAQIDALVGDTPEPDRTNKPAWVRSWSKKIAVPGVGTTAVAGSKAKVSATKVRRKDAASVRYAWRVGNRLVDRDRTVRLTDAHIGKPLMLTVTARKPGTKAARLVLTYGKVRKAA
jgi:hypothetical protein